MFKLCLWRILFTQVLFYLTAIEVFYSLLILPFVIGLMMKFVQNSISNLQHIWADMLFYVFTDHFSHVLFFQIWRIERYLMILIPSEVASRCRLCNPKWSAALGDPQLAVTLLPHGNLIMFRAEIFYFWAFSWWGSYLSSSANLRIDSHFMFIGLH